MQVHMLWKQQGTKPTTKQTSTDARIAALDAKLRINSQPEEGHIKKKEGETPKEPAWRRKRRNPVVTSQALGAKHKLFG